MAHRTQITLREDQYRRLRAEAERTGASLSELLRRAVDATYKPTDIPVEDKLRILEETAGLWSDDQADEFLERKRSDWEARRTRLKL